MDVASLLSEAPSPREPPAAAHQHQQHQGQHHHHHQQQQQHPPQQQQQQQQQSPPQFHQSPLSAAYLVPSHPPEHHTRLPPAPQPFTGYQQQYPTLSSQSYHDQRSRSNSGSRFASDPKHQNAYPTATDRQQQQGLQQQPYPSSSMYTTGGGVSSLAGRGPSPPFGPETSRQSHGSHHALHHDSLFQHTRVPSDPTLADMRAYAMNSSSIHSNDSRSVSPTRHKADRSHSPTHPPSLTLQSISQSALPNLPPHSLGSHPSRSHGGPPDIRASLPLPPSTTPQHASRQSQPAVSISNTRPPKRPTLHVGPNESPRQSGPPEPRRERDRDRDRERADRDRTRPRSRERERPRDNGERERDREAQQRERDRHAHGYQLDRPASAALPPNAAFHHGRPGSNATYLQQPASESTLAPVSLIDGPVSPSSLRAISNGKIPSVLLHNGPNDLAPSSSRSALNPTLVPSAFGNGPSHSHVHVHGAHTHTHLHSHIHHLNISGTGDRGPATSPELPLVRAQELPAVPYIHSTQPQLPPVPIQTFPDPPNLGTFVYPNTPLPLPITPTLPPYSTGLQQLVTPPPAYSFTVLIPSSHLLSSIPKLLPIWGTQGGSTADVSEGTVGYTDDSDVRLMVLHAKFVSLDEMRKNKNERKDLSIRLLWRGVKTKFRGTLGSVEGGNIQSASWGTSHDGGALEIAKTEWLPKGYAHSRHIPNRKARMLQYTNERARLNLLPPSPSGASPSPETPLSALPSNRSDTASSTSRSSDATAVELDMEEGEEEGGKLSVLLDFGDSNDEPTASFVYDPDLLRVAVFPPPNGSTAVHRPKKRRRLDPSEPIKSPSPEDLAERTKTRTIVLIGDATYMLQPDRPTSNASPSRPTCTLRRIKSAKKSLAPVEGEAILGTELDQEDLEFSPAGFRFRRPKSVGDGAADIMSPMCRVQRWRYVFDEQTLSSKTA